MDIIKILKNIDDKNEEFLEEYSGTYNNNLYYNNSIVNYEENEGKLGGFVRC